MSTYSCYLQILVDFKGKEQKFNQIEWFFFITGHDTLQSCCCTIRFDENIPSVKASIEGADMKVQISFLTVVSSNNWSSLVLKVCASFMYWGCKTSAKV